MIGFILGGTTVTLYLLGVYMMQDWIPQINNLLKATGRPELTKKQVRKFLLLWPYTVVEDIIKARKQT